MKNILIISGVVIAVFIYSQMNKIEPIIENKKEDLSVALTISKPIKIPNIKKEESDAEKIIRLSGMKYYRTMY